MACRGMGQQVGDGRIQTGQIAEERCRQRGRLGIGMGRLECESHARERRAELMRGIGAEMALALERIGDPYRAVMEGVGEVVDLGDAGARQFVTVDTLDEAIGACRELFDGLGEPASDPTCE